MMWLILFIAFVIGCAYWSLKGVNEPLDVRGKSVFISGCDSGFGHGLALRLDRLGMKVFAGCLTSKGAADLRTKGSSQLEAVVCDITKSEDIANVVKVVTTSCPEGLWALVNNAGIAVGGEWDWVPEKSIRQVMEVNFFGHVAVTKAFLSQLKKTKGRVINLTSVAGYATETGLGAYSCSKFAMEAFSDSLRREMRKWGVSVFIVEPGFTATPMVLNAGVMIAKLWDDASEEIKQEYGEEYGQEIKNVKIPRLDPPEMVLDALQAKVVNKYPLMRSRVGILSTIAYVGNTFLPTSWLDVLLSLRTRPIPGPLRKKTR